MNTTFKTVLFWVLMVTLATFLWKMAAKPRHGRFSTHSALRRSAETEANPPAEQSTPQLTTAQIAELDTAFADLQDSSMVDVQNSKKTDHGYARLKELGASGGAQRAYIAQKLPQLIAVGPSEKLQFYDPRWRNELDLAENLRIVEAAPAMVRQIEYDEGGPAATLTSESSINRRPAAMALVALGDLAVPALKDGVERAGANSSREPYYSAIALTEIGTPAARAALMSSSLRERYPDVYAEMMSRLGQKGRP